MEQTTISIFENGGVCSKYLSGMTCEELGGEYDVHRSTIRNFLVLKNVKRRPTCTRRALSREECAEAINLYLSGKTFKEVGKIYGVDKATIRLVLRRNNLKGRISRPIYRKDDDFFKKINTKEKAWLLGLIYADGSISNRQGLRFAFAKKDIELIYKIKRMLESNAPVYIHPNSSVHFRVMGQDFIKNLSKWCVMGKKDDRLIYPGFLRKDLHSHFIRGFFDGDGWAGNRSGICSMSRPFLERILDILQDRNICKMVHVNADKKSSCSSIRIQAKDDIKNFYNLIYKDADESMLLSRKRKRFEEVLGGRNESV